MAINVVTDFPDVATVRIITYVHDDDEALADATAVTIDVYDPDGTQQVDGEAMTKTATGTYTYYYHKGSGETAMDEGDWYGDVLVADGTGADTVYSTGHFEFEVK